MFSVPFVLMGVCYGALPSELPVLGIPMGHAMTSAAKSVFTVFRVPLMNLTHGLMAAVMLSRARDFENAERRASYASLFATLLFTIAVKSDIEAVDISLLAAPGALGSYERWLAPATLLAVLAGLSLAAMRGRRAPIPWPELRLRIRDKVALAGLFALYLGLVIASFRVSHPA
jgi:hypothetical protein